MQRVVNTERDADSLKIQLSVVWYSWGLAGMREVYGRKGRCSGEFKVGLWKVQERRRVDMRRN